MEKPLKSFHDVPNPPSPIPPTGKVKGQQVIPQTKEIRIGIGNTVFNADISGIWLGKNTWAGAPFRVDMTGNLWANSVTITGGSITGTEIGMNSGATDPTPVPSIIQLFYNTTSHALKISVGGVWNILSTVISPSASRSPSASESKSVSPSASQSKSISPSSSISPSASASYST